MKNLIIIILGLVFFSSCLTVKRIEKNCDKFATVCVTDKQIETIYKDAIIYVDRDVPVPIPGDTVRIKVPIIVKDDNNKPIPRAKISIDPIHRESEHLILNAKIANNKIVAEAVLKEGFVIVPIKDTITIKGAIQKTTIDNTIVLPPEKYVPGWYKFTNWFFIGFWILIAVWLFWNFKSGLILKILGKFNPYK